MARKGSNPAFNLPRGKLCSQQIFAPFFIYYMEKQLQRGVIYYRVSTSEQAEHGFSLDYQREACLKHAESRGIDIVAEYHDDGISAKTTNRKGLQEMIKFCSVKSNHIDCVVVNKVDRLSRDVNDYTSIFTQFTKQGITLVSTTEAINDTPFGKCVGNIMATFAQLDNDMRSERVTVGMKKCIESGRWPFMAPIGYLNHIDKNNKKTIIVDQTKASLVTYIFNEYATGVYTEEEIRQRVNTQGLRSHRGKEISSQMIHKILVEKFYIGEMTMNGIDYQGTHRPLTTKENFYQCQKFLKKYDKKTMMSLSRSEKAFPLRNFVLCAQCSRPLTAAFSTGKSGKKFPYYRCYNRHCTGLKSISKGKLEEQFYEYLKEIIPDKRYTKAIKHMALEVWEKNYKEFNISQDQLTTEIRQLKREKRNTFDLLGKGLISETDFKEQLDNIKISIDEKETSLTETPKDNFDFGQALDSCFNFFETIPDYWKEIEYSEKIKLQSSIFSKKPTYQNSTFETPKFSLIFQQKREFASANPPVVARRGIEPLFQP